MPGPNLDVTRIYACLLHRGNAESFRWLLAIPYNNGSSVTKFHAVDEDNIWWYERADYHVKSSVRLCVAMEIGKSSVDSPPYNTSITGLNVHITRYLEGRCHR